MIRFIVETFSSAFDLSGNRSHCATVTSTATGKHLMLRDLGGVRNALGLVRQLTGAEYDAIYSTESEGIPRRQFAQYPHQKTGVYEHLLTADMLKQLEISP